jgi:hypothetical protein
MSRTFAFGRWRRSASSNHSITFQSPSDSAVTSTQVNAPSVKK